MEQLKKLCIGVCTVWRWLCYAAILGALGVVVWQLGLGIAAVCEGEMTAAEMIEGMGRFLTGK